MHAGSVALVLNPQAGYVLPQYHVVFDDNFLTVPHMRDGTTPPLGPKGWLILFADGFFDRQFLEFFLKGDFWQMDLKNFFKDILADWLKITDCLADFLNKFSAIFWPLFVLLWEN